MGNKVCRLIRPKQGVEGFGLIRRAGINEYAATLTVSLFGDTRRYRKARMFPLLVTDIEIYACHQYYLPARPRRYCTSMGTGRPVAPFGALLKAVPATSRCAHL